MEPVAVLLVFDEYDNHQTDCHAEGKTENVDEGKSLMFPQGSHCNQEIVSHHDETPADFQFHVHNDRQYCLQPEPEKSRGISFFIQNFIVEFFNVPVQRMASVV